MELTRRDALAALAGAGIVGGGAVAALVRDDEFSGAASDRSGAADRRRVVEALVATADVVYPSEVENAAAFAETYASAKLDRREAYRTGATETLSDLDAHADLHFDRAYADLDPDERESVLESTGTRSADPDPDGTTPERIRYFYVNELLYALYTSPAGGELVGVKNPQGHPGGTDSYQRGPNR